MTTAVVAGAGPGRPGEAFEDEDTAVVRVAGIASADSFNETGIEDADLFVLTGMGGAAAIAVTKKQNPDVCVVTYAYDTLPEFARGQVDLAVDPSLLAVDVVAKELV